MIWIILALVTAPTTLPLTARVVLGEGEGEAILIAMLVGLIPAAMGVLLAMGLVVS